MSSTVESAAPRPAAARNLAKFAWLSIAAALATIALKSGAYLVTGSVGLLSDAAESVVNLVAAVVALIALKVAARPADDSHHFGHTKAEYFSAIVEGIMIFVAAMFILWAAIPRLLDPMPLENVGLGLGISVFASLINGGVALVLMRAGRQYRSITLEADGKHLLTDVWTSVGVVVGVLLVWASGYLILDPIIAILVGINILVTGWGLVSRSVDGLMDRSLDDGVHQEITNLLEEYAGPEVQFHAVRTRESGHQRFASMHMLVPGDWSVKQAHDLAHEVEVRLHERVPELLVETHIEPREDPRAYEEDLPGLSVGHPPSGMSPSTNE